MHILGGQLLCTPLCSQDFSDTQGQKDAVKLQGTHALNKTLRVIRKIQRARGVMYMYCGKYEVTNATSDNHLLIPVISVWKSQTCVLCYYARCYTIHDTEVAHR